MKNINFNHGNKVPEVESHSYLNKKNIIRFLILILCLLAGYSFIGILIWKVSIRWATIPKSSEKTFLFIAGFLLLVIEFVISFMALRISRRLISEREDVSWKMVKDWLFYPFETVLILKKRLQIMIIIPGLIAIDLGYATLLILLISIEIKSDFINTIRENWIIIIVVSLFMIIGAIILLVINVNYAYWLITGRIYKGNSKYNDEKEQ
jgi:hypothetical protein